ncbi:MULTISPECIES: LysR family transcriptional regulator [unclassified Mannheimia]|uniref:LysR family transcriptional regulator n=1 Tax=unclassified Mannheimia TaxID=2645054 RepID=UPI00359D14C8
MNLNTLPLFTHIIQTGSLSKTAEQTGVPIATISRQIVELEKSLGVQLFDRHKTGVKPTMAGQQFYEQIALSVDNLTQIAQHFSAESSELTGKLRISTVTAMSEVWDLLDEFCVLNPKVSVHLEVTDRVLDLVEDGIDFAFRVGDLHTDSVVARPLFTTQTKWLSHPKLLAQFGTPKTLADLAKFPLVGYAKSDQKLLRIPNGKKTLELPYTFASNDVYAIQNAIKNGRGIGMLSHTMANRLIEEYGLVEILADTTKPDFTVHLLYVKHRHQSALMRAFLDFVSTKF